MSKKHKKEEYEAPKISSSCMEISAILCQSSAQIDVQGDTSDIDFDRFIIDNDFNW